LDSSYPASKLHASRVCPANDNRTEVSIIAVVGLDNCRSGTFRQNLPVTLARFGRPTFLVPGSTFLFVLRFDRLQICSILATLQLPLALATWTFMVTNNLNSGSNTVLYLRVCSKLSDSFQVHSCQRLGPLQLPTLCHIVLRLGNLLWTGLDCTRKATHACAVDLFLIQVPSATIYAHVRKPRNVYLVP
jgi:hypothetical protein